MAFLGFVIAGLFLLIQSTGPVADDPVAHLRQRIERGEAKLDYAAQHGYLKSLLSVLNVPVTSQTLVFSKTSLQSERISPAAPRALYFNDDVYVAWVRGASIIEIMAVDPKLGSAFYLLGQQGGRPIFERSSGHECSVCHFSQESKTFVPRLLVSSVLPDMNGGVEGTFPIPTTDQSPFEERWGGWYVTGNLGDQRHLGNIVLKTPASAFSTSGPPLARVSNLADLRTRIDTAPYLTPHSDVVALMVLGHQVEVHNLMALAGAKSAPPPQVIGERLVKAMLFSGAVGFKAPVQGSSKFAAEFAARGPRDNRGRSLRDLDLKTRLFRYPLSYLIYSKAFEGMPDAVKTHVNRRLKEVLAGTDKSKDFAHLSSSDRTAILEILRSTKPGF